MITFSDKVMSLQFICGQWEHIEAKVDLIQIAPNHWEILNSRVKTLLGNPVTDNIKREAEEYALKLINMQG